MKSNKPFVVFILLLLIGSLGFDYCITKYRLEKIYKVENPSFVHILWEMGRK